MGEKQFMTTNKVFRIAYTIGKMGCPFSDMPVECDVHTLNGVDIGTTLHSDKSCQAILDHIGQEMRSKICEVIINDDLTKISVIIDESTSVSKKSALMIYIKVCLPDTVETVEVENTTFYLDIVELDNQGVECIFKTLMNCLERHGFTLQSDLLCL